MVWTTVEQLAIWNGHTLYQRAVPLNTCTGTLEVSILRNASSKMCIYLNATFLYPSIKGGEWIGHYNQTTKQYSSINGTNLEHSLKVVQLLVDRHKSDPIVVGLEPRKSFVLMPNHRVEEFTLMLLLLRYSCELEFRSRV